MKLIGHLLMCLFLSKAYAVKMEPKLPDVGVVSDEKGPGMDPEIDYSKFTGRVSDKDDSGRIFKVKTEMNYPKFFRSGDPVYFEVQTVSYRRKCKGFVRHVEDYYFTMHVEHLSPCWRGGYFRRGTVLKFDSPVLGQRVFEATKFRESLVIKKQDFLKQLSSINNFLWSFEQQRLNLASDYDKKILELQKQKQMALDDLVKNKQEQMIVQAELMRKLTELDDSLKFYRIDRQELLTDRWNMDHDSALPVGQRPQELRKE